MPNNDMPQFDHLVDTQDEEDKSYVKQDKVVYFINPCVIQ